MTERLVKEYYSDQGEKEWRRLVRDPYHRLEFDTTLHFLDKYIPEKSFVLDVGGGPGRYTVELAMKGHEVVLLDLTPRQLEIAKKRIKRAGPGCRVSGVLKGSMDDLSRFEDSAFDAVICLGGALSHVVDKRKRENAIDELVRVAGKGAPIFVSVIGRLAVLTSELVRFPREIEVKKVFQRIRDTGDYRGGYGFAPCHFYLPEELRSAFEMRGVEVLEMAGLEGLASGHPREANMLSRRRPKAWKIWWETHLGTCTHPAAVGMSEHFLLVCRK